MLCRGGREKKKKRGGAPGQLGSQLPTAGAHLGPGEVTGESKPCSKAKLAQKPFNPPPSKIQFSEPQLHSSYFSRKAAAAAAEGGWG